jgi:thiol-disulfide isomerase/thioredoxin
MVRNTLSKKGSRKAGNKAPSGSNRGIVLVLAGFTAAAILVIALFAIVSTTGGGDASNFTPNDQGLLPVGSEAPEFTAETVGGGSISVGGGNADATMLVFFATWCPHCQNEAPIISDLENEYEDLRIVMIGADGTQGDTPADVQEFVDRYDIQSPAVYDPDLGQRYQITGYPTVYVLDGNGEIVAANSGEAPREVYEEWIQEALGS